MHKLVPHPDAPPVGIRGVDVRWFEPGNGTLVLRWIVDGMAALQVPPFAGNGRADGLWKTTCFELFLADRDGGGYAEFNFSPCNFWAAYRFDGYRTGMVNAPMPFDPVIAHEAGTSLFVFTATIRADVLRRARAAGLAAVIEERDGTTSYWALAHAAGKPDFHDPACFALPLAAPDAS